MRCKLMRDGIPVRNTAFLPHTKGLDPRLSYASDGQFETDHEGVVHVPVRNATNIGTGFFDKDEVVNVDIMRSNDQISLAALEAVKDFGEEMYESMDPALRRVAKKEARRMER